MQPANVITLWFSDPLYIVRNDLRPFFNNFPLKNKFKFDNMTLHLEFWPGKNTSLSYSWRPYGMFWELLICIYSIKKRGRIWINRLIYKTGCTNVFSDGRHSLRKWKYKSPNKEENKTKHLFPNNHYPLAFSQASRWLNLIWI